MFNPEIKVIGFNVADVITVSGGTCATDCSEHSCQYDMGGF